MATTASADNEWLIRCDNCFGVIDHNSTGTGNGPDFVDPEDSAYLGVGTNGDNSWAQPVSLGGPNNLFVENNVAYTQAAVIDTEKAPIGGGVGGGRYVTRFNHIFSNNGFGIFGNHGLDTDGRPQGGLQIENYANIVQCIGTGSCASLTGTRSGILRIWGNNLTRTGTGFFGNFSDINVYRVAYTVPTTGWAACGGSSPYDTNDGSSNVATIYYSGTVTSSSNPQSNGMATENVTMTDTSKTWTTNQFIPTGRTFLGLQRDARLMGRNRVQY